MRLSKKKVIALLRQANGHIKRERGRIKGSDENGKASYCALGVIAHLVGLEPVVDQYTHFTARQLRLVDKHGRCSPMAKDIYNTNDSCYDGDFTVVANLLAKKWGLE
jgi:hypothetical protein